MHTSSLLSHCRLVALFVCLAGWLAVPAQASESLSDTNVGQKITLKVNSKGEALISYKRSNGAARNVLAWGAVNALPPNEATPQVRFKYDYAGGWGKYRKLYWKTFQNACKPYDGPKLPYFVTGCKAPDGSYWALQRWQRLVPLLGIDPWLPQHTAWEVHLSHWKGPLAELEFSTNWTYGGTSVGVFGRLTYLGAPVYGFRSTATGNPLGRFERNIYIDTFNSVYGPGYKRESGILTHKTTGTFCHSFVPQKIFPGYPNAGGTRPAAPGTRYRATVMGPGVTPVIQVEVPGLGRFDRAEDEQYNQLFDRVMAGDRICAGER